MDKIVDMALPWWKLVVGLMIGAVLVFPVGQCSGVKIQKDRVEAARVKGLERNGDAREAAAEQRGRDSVKVTDGAEGRSSAVEGIPDESPGAVRRAFNCQRLRDAGGRLPAGC